MPSVATQLAEALNECRNLREALSKEVEERRRDHDKLIKVEEWMKTLFNRVTDLEREVKELRESTEKANIHHRVKQLEDGEKERKEKAKEGRSRSWAIFLELIGALFAAIIGGIAARYFFK